jgi:hypothetical protein
MPMAALMRHVATFAPKSEPIVKGMTAATAVTRPTIQAK